MLSLIYKDLRVGLPFLVVLVVMFILGSAGAVRAPVYFWVSLVFAATLMLGLSQMDWRHGADRFAHSLPVSRRLVVYSRYASALLGGALTLAIAVAAGLLRGMVLDTVGQAWPRMMAADVALAWVLLFTFVVAIYLPCYFRWGHGKGYIIGALAIAGGVIAGSFIQRAVDRVQVAAELPRDLVAAANRLPRGLVVSSVVDAAARLGLPLTAAIVLGLSGVLILASSRLSILAYRHREF
jgi:hypothetical protein